MNDTKTDFTVKVGEKALKALTLLSNATKLSAADTLRHALGFYMWAFTEWKAGRRIGSIEENGETDTVYFVNLAFMDKDEKNSNSGVERVSETKLSGKNLN